MTATVTEKPRSVKSDSGPQPSDSQFSEHHIRVVKSLPEEMARVFLAILDVRCWGECYFSSDQIHERTGIDRWKIPKYVHALSALGILKNCDYYPSNRKWCARDNSVSFK